MHWCCGHREESVRQSLGGIILGLEENIFINFTDRTYSGWMDRQLGLLAVQ